MRAALLADKIDRVLNVLKWPVAVAAALVAPAAGLAMLHVLAAMLQEPGPALAFLAGAVIYGALWWWVLRRWRNSYWLTLEHELTHALFALVTLHRVTRIHATASRGGYIAYQGRGNWLITIAPYFFPIACLALVVVFAFLPGLAGLGDAMLGAAFIYHLTSTWRETHGGQTDLQRVTWLFALLFLPAANLLTLGIVLAFAHTGTAGVGRFLSDIVSQLARIYGG